MNAIDYAQLWKIVCGKNATLRGLVRPPEMPENGITCDETVGYRLVTATDRVGPGNLEGKHGRGNTG
jgi:hypothetical protein